MRLGGQDIPDDLKALLNAYSCDPDFEGSDLNPLNVIWAELLWADKKHPLLDHDYLNEQDRKNADIMANVQAMKDTEKKLRFVIQLEDTSLLGYWQPDPEVPLNKCPLFWLDTEGEYSLADGKSLSETLSHRLLEDGDEDSFQSLLDAFGQLGVFVQKADREQILADKHARAAEIDENPEEFRNQRYEHYRSLKEA